MSESKTWQEQELERRAQAREWEERLPITIREKFNKTFELLLKSERMERREHDDVWEDKRTQFFERMNGSVAMAISNECTRAKGFVEFTLSGFSSNTVPPAMQRRRKWIEERYFDTSGAFLFIHRERLIRRIYNVPRIMELRASLFHEALDNEAKEFHARIEKRWQERCVAMLLRAENLLNDRNITHLFMEGLEEPESANIRIPIVLIESFEEQRTTVQQRVFFQDILVPILQKLKEDKEQEARKKLGIPVEPVPKTAPHKTNTGKKSKEEIDQIGRVLCGFVNMLRDGMKASEAYKFTVRAIGKRDAGEFSDAEETRALFDIIPKQRADDFATPRAVEGKCSRYLRDNPQHPFDSFRRGLQGSKTPRK